MKIYIRNISNTLNYGSMMMAENIITYLNNAVFPKPIYYVDAKEEMHITRLKNATEYEKIYSDKTYALKEKQYNNILGRIYNKLKREYTYTLKKCPYDIVIILGGDDYSEIYYKVPEETRHIMNVLKQLETLNKKSKVFMVGQTIGPYTGERLDRAKQVFSKVDILTRDDVSHQYIKDEMGIEAFKMRDLAFLDLHLEDTYKAKYQEILNEYGILENEYITIVGSGLYSCYTKNEEEYNNVFVNVIKKIQDKYPNKKIVLLSHVANEDKPYSDTTFINKIKNDLPEDVVVITKQMLPIKARIILGFGYFTLTYRMHAAVSTYHMLKPAICIAYSPKYVGVIGDGLNMHDLIIYLDKENFTQNSVISEVTKKLEYLENNRNDIIKNIEVKVAECKEKANYGLKQIIDYIKDGGKDYE